MSRNVAAEIVRGRRIPARVSFDINPTSREHAAIAPRNLGLRLVLAKNFARIHRQNLINCGVLPLLFADARDFDELQVDGVLRAGHLHRALTDGAEIVLEGDHAVRTRHNLDRRQMQVILGGGLLNWRRNRARRAAS